MFSTQPFIKCTVFVESFSKEYYEPVSENFVLRD